MKISPRLIVSLAVGAVGLAATYLWRRTKPQAPFDAIGASSLLGRKVKENDLTIIDGIGPKIAELLLAAGIQTWDNLSRTSAQRCREILDATNGFSLHAPTHWPIQAKLASQGKWRELKDWQSKSEDGR